MDHWKEPLDWKSATRSSGEAKGMRIRNNKEGMILRSM